MAVFVFRCSTRRLPRHNKMLTWRSRSVNLRES